MYLSVMAGYFVNGGEIPLHYFDRTTYERTFKVKAFGVSMKDLFLALCELLHSEEVVDICKVDSNTFNISVKDEQAAEILNNVGRLRIKDKLYPLISISKQTVEFRVHWLPSYIKDSFVEDFFSHYGKVTSVTRDAAVFTPNDTKRTGVRRVMMETDELRKRTIPYVITFSGGYSALITMAGRPPLCLRCRQIGHLRKDCVPINSSQTSDKKATYSQATGSRQQGAGHSATADDEEPHQETESQETMQAEVVGHSGMSEEGAEQGATGGGGDEGNQTLDSKGSTIPPNVQKRDLSDGEADDDDDNYMIDDDQFTTVGPGGKKLKS